MYEFPSIAERAQKFEQCELAAVAMAICDRDANERCAGPFRVKVEAPLPPAVGPVGVLRDVKRLSEGREMDLTDIKCLPIIFWGGIS